ncbi:MAG: NUDIX hydrolase [Chitinophagales bacterium]|nr:NUDIX hydrolase [Chitinophagales bacterium]
MMQLMKYCCNCGADVHFIDVEGDNRKRFVCDNCKTIHYTNPKVVAGALVYWEDKVLLCKRAIEPRFGYWNLPAGYLEDGETSEEGAAREVMEEAGAEFILKGVHAVYNLPQANQVYIHFLGELKDGKYANGPESIETALFTEEQIPWNDMAFTSSYFALKRYFEDKRNGVEKTHLGTFPQKK